ncbi:MAG TPA: hypothetical protein VMU64_14555 [Acidimicrobiales bacterium]|nr:hypothetical protein [Acidimicrobiales bacterium]
MLVLHEQIYKHFTRGSEVQGVAYKIRDDPAESAGVAPEGHRQIVGKAATQLETSPVSRSGKGVGDVLYQAAKIESNRLQIMTAGLDLGEVQDVVENAGEIFTRGKDRLREYLVIDAGLHVVQL